ncbi:matrix-remodeling-associated protein 5-like [Labrus mixtus]|uniref:matrix-remodeling-associated protein 5-like n=1 Tax=Labrus mixtus TaxID=508554 RepID=UPI0029BFF4B2|nr:matrix-remodeling-associated protein 5-like [Labrus mixtus]
MCRSVCVPGALLTLLVLTLVLPTGQACPRSCNCYQASEVHCTFRSLLAIPPGLPVHTRRMNLGFNSISRIHETSLTGLKKVELLMLHSNDLHHIPDAVFRDLKSLQILKLSYNKLREISSSLTFSGLTSLLRLYLDHNLLQHIHPRALLQLPSLRLLRLQGNRLHQLHPHTLCTLSLLNTYYFSTLRHLDLSNNSLTTLPSETLATAPLLETLVLQDNPWSCDCRMNWFLTWSLAHPGFMKCPGGPQCPICASPKSLQGQGLFDQIDLPCKSPVIISPGRVTPLETELIEIQSRESFREPLGTASLGLSDQQGNSVDLSCNITHSSDSQDIAPPPDLSLSSSSPLPLALSLSLDCPVERQSYEKLWRILAYYSETAVRLERELMLSKAPALAYRYRQTVETDGYYHTGVRASVKAMPQWLLQPAISIQLNRAQSNGIKVQLIYSTRVSAHPDPISHSSTSNPAFHPWTLISTNHTITALATVARSKVELPCPLLSSGSPKVEWVLPDGSKLISPSNNLDGRLLASNSGLLIHKVMLSDAGIYYCIARTGRDVDVMPLRLAVEESSIPPSGEHVGPPAKGAVGEPISLSCEVSGSPLPYLSWVLPDGNTVRRGLAVSGGVTMQSNGSLSLPNPTKRDAGHYRCIAVNQYGSDSMSMQLELKSQHPLSLKNSFSRGPQSAAGRSTRIRAPLLRLEEEGSGDEEEEEKTTIGNRRHQRPLQLPPNRRHPIGQPRGRGLMREGPLRRGGRPVSSTDKRRNRFENRHRVTTNKQRIDPKKWADLLEKIRQKTAQTNNSQPIAEGTATAEAEGKSRHEGGDDTDKGRTEASEVEAETEGSSVDGDDLKQEGSESIPTDLTKMPSHIGTETDTEITKETDRSRETQTDIENETETHIHTEKPTETVTNPETRQEQVTSKPIPGRNEIIPEAREGNEQEENPSLSRTRPQKPRQGIFPNLVPNSRPQSPWNSRRRIGQRRRIINRQRGQPFSPTQPLPDPRSQTDTTTDQLDTLLLVSSTTSPAERLRTAPINSLFPPVSNSLGIFTSNFDSLSATPPPSSTTSLSSTHTKAHIDMMTQSANFPDIAESNPISTLTPAPTHSHTAISFAQTHVPDTHTETHIHTTSGKHVDRPPSKHSEEPKRNSLGVPYVSQSLASVSPTPSSIASTEVVGAVTIAITTVKITSPSTTLESTHSNIMGSSKSLSTAIDSENTLPVTTTTSPMTPPPIISTKTTITTPTSSPTRSTTTLTSTTTPTTPILTSTLPTTTTTSSTSPSTTFTTTTAPSTKVLSNAISTTLNPTTTTFMSTTTTTTTTTATTTKTTNPTISSRITISATHSPTTTQVTTSSTPSTTTTRMTSTPTAASPKERPSAGQVDPRWKHASRDPNQSRPPTEWKNPGANSIPDSHSGRPLRPPSSSLPVAPGEPVVKSRPRIADPHIRTVSFPAESTARLDCEAKGEPKPSITWTKVATGAVMSIHSRAQRFEVLPNGTLVIQNVQQQDRGTYICSAHSFLGRDRLLTTLEVWTRPPRMQLASYRESTIHQGGAVHLECQADGIPTPLLSWVLPDRSVLTSTSPSASRINMDTNGTLHISVTLPSDRGVYRCVASNSAGAASASARVHVSSLPPVIQQPRDEHLLLSPGRPVYAHCSARGAPQPTLRWRIPDGTLVRPSQFLHGNLFVLPNGTLHIRRVEPKDTGNYECTASNAVGADKRTVRVEIEVERTQGGAGHERARAVAAEKPSSSSFHEEKNFPIPSQPPNPFRLPPPSLFDRSRNLPDSSSSSRFSFPPHQLNPTNSPPKINKTVTSSPTHLANINRTLSTLPTNNTRVSIGIVNNTRLTSTPSDKKGPSTLPPSPVSPFSKARIVSTTPPISTIHYGEILQLHCTVTGNPSPIIIWRTPNRKLVDMHFSFDRRFKVHPNGTLSVQTVTEKDAGDYLCIARNKVSDDYRLLRVSVATKPAKIEPKQPHDQMVLFGKPLKVDCQASGLPDPAVQWSLPDGTMVNSVLQGEERGRRTRRLTVFDNGTLLVPAVGMGEEGEYTCYAENQGGKDTMKVKVKIMMTSPPAFNDDRSYHVIKVPLGGTATIPCRATGDPTPTVTWISPTHRVIPNSLGSRFYSERVVVVSGGTLEVRMAQKIDTGNYTCRAGNSAGEKSMVIGLVVESPNYGQHAGGRGWSTSNGPASRSGENIKNGVTNKFGGSNNNGHSGNNGRLGNIVPNTGISVATSVLNPVQRSDSQGTLNRPVSRITTHLGSSVISVGVSGASNIGFKADNTEITRNGPITTRGNNSLGNSHNTARGNIVERKPGTYNNEVIAGKSSNDANTGISRNVGIVSSSVSNHGAGSFRENGFSSGINTGAINAYSRISAGSSSANTAAHNTGTKNSSNTLAGMITTVKKRSMKGQTVILPCPSQGSPPPRVAWLLPGNGVLPAPYYGSRLTVHRNGSLELRGVRVSDSGTLVCVVRGQQGESRIQVELEVSEVSSNRAPAVERPAQGSFGSNEVPNPRFPVTPRPSLTVVPHPVGPPLRSTGLASEPVLSTRTAPLVSIINGETLCLPCPASQTYGYTQRSLSWTMPSGKVMSLGESGESGRFIVGADGTLTIQQATVFDRGSYTCRSQSIHSSSVSVLTVPVIVIAYPPRITTGPSPVTYTRPGVAVELPCMTIATPRATVTWETPDLTQLIVMGQARIYGNRYLSPQGSLVIQNPTSRDTGFYRCTAKNVIGVDTKATYLHVI